MNGRMYDATLARFISADPHIQAGSLSQSYNRYSYALNNPMKYTDPSGYFIKKLVKAIKKIGKAIAKAYESYWQATTGSILRAVAKVPWLNAIVQGAACSIGGPLGCAAFAFASAYAVTGDFGVALKAGAIAGATASLSTEIGNSNFGATTELGVQASRAVAHGMVGGTMNVVRGGKFGHGFASFFFTKMVSGNFGAGPESSFGEKLAGASIAALVGGTASALGGGKFKNGAETAAIQYLFNEVGNNLAVGGEGSKRPLPNVTEDDLVLTQGQARKVYDFYFSKMQLPDQLNTMDRRIAQALLVQGIESSGSMAMVQKLVNSVLLGGTTSARAIVGTIGQQSNTYLFYQSRANSVSFNSPIYISVRNQINASFASSVNLYFNDR